MHPLYQKADKLSRDTIGSAIEVHRQKGAGLIESIGHCQIVPSIIGGAILAFGDERIDTLPPVLYSMNPCASTFWSTTAYWLS